jgi:hypothetical protein
LGRKQTLGFVIFSQGNTIRGGERMNKKIFGIIVALLTISLIVTPFAFAKPWNPKNNDKFKDFSVTLVPNFANIAAGIANAEYIPSADNPNKVIVTWIEEPMIDYTITVDGTTYFLGTDFDYTGVAVYTSIGAPFTPNAIGLPIGTKEQKFRVDYKYDFDAVPGGIEGTLEMLAITANPGGMMIRSLRGTGDLQNVQIFATGVGFGHVGLVIGWPE